MIRTIEDFSETWKTESEATLKILRALTDASLARAITNENRTLGRLAWHIVRSIPEMMVEAKQPLGGFDLDAPTPTSASAMTEAYAGVAASLRKLVGETWTDESLQVTDKMFGEEWKRGFTLEALIHHEIHHRGQMTVLMRQAGLKVPGIYGPSLEDWAGYGMKPPEV